MLKPGRMMVREVLTCAEGGSETATHVTTTWAAVTPRG